MKIIRTLNMKLSQLARRECLMDAPHVSGFICPPLSDFFFNTKKAFKVKLTAKAWVDASECKILKPNKI